MVWRVRDRRIDRIVALKTLHDHYYNDDKARRRFQAEARITGQLQHPGIPPVHELGELPDGRPYMVMKLVRGETLKDLLALRMNDSASETSGASLGQCIAIFEQICQAVGYAHAHQVIHRDLKPSNVMVGSHGEVQVMDWGLAKVLAPSPQAQPADESEELAPTICLKTEEISASEDVLGTKTGVALGTPSYMPPEQAAGEVHKLDARSDVFALGAILCEILTGRPPYTGHNHHAVRLKAVRWDIAEAFARLDRCGAEPELVALCKRCLAFRQEDRPADGNAVAAEVARLRLDTEQCPRQAELAHAQALVRAQEQAQRRRLLAWSASLMLAVLLAGLAVSVWQMVRALRAEALAKENEQKALTAEAHARQRAEEREAETRAVLEFVESKIFAAARPAGQDGGLGHDVRLADAIRQALPYVETSFADQPLIEARLRMTIGISFLYLGEAQIALQQFLAARNIYEQYCGPDHSNTLHSMNNLANSYAQLGRHEEALKLREETLRRCQAKLGPDHPDTLLSMNNLANSYARLGRHEEALKLREETLRLCRDKLGPEHPDTLSSMDNLASCYVVLGRHDEALKLQEETLRLRCAKLGPEHPDTLSSMNNLANSYFALRRYADAAKLHEETMRLRRAKLGVDHPDTLTSMDNLANCYVVLGRHEEALKLHEETLRLRRAKLGPDHPDTLRSMHNLALNYYASGRYAESAKLHEETLRLLQAKLGPDHPDMLLSMYNLANVYAELGRYEEAVRLGEALVGLGRAKLGPDHPDTLRIMHNLAASYFCLGRYAQSAKLLEETLGVYQAKLGPDHPDTILSMFTLASSLIQMKHYARAEELLLQVESAVAKGRLGIDPNVCRNMVPTLVELYQAWGKPTEAAKWRAKLPPSKQKPPQK
ncbi:MAG: serine/threonine-protein kinase [Gemmatales bacterium]|nr:serine/threonine-protein kinase [Gemmatales bacterium]